MASATFEIPLIASPQTFSVSLNGTTYEMAVFWCEPDQCWILNIADAQGIPILRGVPLITGANLLAQYEYLGIPGVLQCQTDHDPFAVPTFDNLGNGGRLYYTPPG